MDYIIDSVYGMKQTDEDKLRYEELLNKLKVIKKSMGKKYILHPKYKNKEL